MSKQIERYPDELTFTEFVESMAVYLSWIKRHILGLTICGLLGAAALGFYAAQQEDQYKAKLTFVLNDQNNPSISGAGGLLSQLGIPISSGRYNIDRLLSTAQSQTIVESTLLSKATLDDRTDYLANFFYDIYEITEIGDYSPGQIRLTTDSISTKGQSYGLQVLYKMLTGGEQSDGIMTLDYGKTDYIMALETTTPDEDLSLAFTHQHYDNVSGYYIDIATQHNQAIYNTVASKRDSIQQLLNQMINQLAITRDRSAGSYRSTSRANIAKMEAQITAYTSALQAAETYVGQADYALQTSTPLIQLLDQPRAPLTPQKPSVLRYILVGLALGLLGYLIIHILKRILSKVDA